MAEVAELKKFELFKLFSDAQLTKIAKIAKKMTFKPKAHVYEHGDTAKYLFVVSKGLVSLRELKPGDEVGIAFEMRERGEIFGAASTMQPQVYTLTAVCMEETELFAIDVDKLLQLCKEDPEIGYKLMQKIAEIYFERYKITKRTLYEMVKTPALITALPG